MITWRARGQINSCHVTMKPRGLFVVAPPRWSAYSPNISLFLYLQLYLYAQLTAHYVPYTGTIFPGSSPQKPRHPLNSFLRRCLSCHQLSRPRRREHQQHSQSQFRQYIITAFERSFLKLKPYARYLSTYTAHARLFTTQTHLFSSRRISHHSQTFFKISSCLRRRRAYSVRAA